MWLKVKGKEKMKKEKCQTKNAKKYECFHGLVLYLHTVL